MASMSPSITPGQMSKFYDLLVAALRKSYLPSDETQQVLEAHGGALADEFVASVRKRVEAISDMIVRHATVDRSCTPQRALDLLGRNQYTDKKVVNGMPQGSGEEVDVHFFRLGRYVTDEELAKEYALRGLTPDPLAQVQVNKDDPSFTDEHPNGAHWQDVEGRWCYATFNRWDDERFVVVSRYGLDWYDCWFFGGVRK